jgi:putative ABC transport system permease protein
VRTLALALRNLLRNRRRTLATLAAIAIGGVSVLLFGGFSADIKYSLQTSYVRTVGHLQIQHRDYYLFGSGDPTAYGIGRYAAILDGIRADPVLRSMVTVATPTLQFGGVAGNYGAGVSRTIIGNGLVAEDHVRMRRWNRYGLDLVAPPMRLAGAPANAAVVGTGVARVLLMCDVLNVPDCPAPERAAPQGGAQIPDDIAALSSAENAASPAAGGAERSARTIELLVGSARGTPNVASLQIVGAENQGFKELDDVYVFTHLAQAQRLVYGATTPKVTAIMVQLEDTSQTAAAIARLQSLLPGWAPGDPLVVRDFAALNPFYVQSLQLFDTIFGFMLVLIGGIVMFTVSNTMNTAVVERTVEVGTLRAIGLRQRDIRRLFVTEGCVIGIAGAALGVVVALAAAWAINHMGFHWRPPGSAERVPLLLTVWGETAMIAVTALVLVLLTTLSAWWPAWRAARLNMVDALRHA